MSTARQEDDSTPEQVAAKKHWVETLEFAQRLSDSNISDAKLLACYLVVSGWDPEQPLELPQSLYAWLNPNLYTLQLSTNSSPTPIEPPPAARELLDELDPAHPALIAIQSFYRGGMRWPRTDAVQRARRSCNVVLLMKDWALSDAAKNAAEAGKWLDASVVAKRVRVQYEKPATGGGDEKRTGNRGYQAEQLLTAAIVAVVDAEGKGSAQDLVNVLSDPSMKALYAALAVRDSRIALSVLNELCSKASFAEILKLTTEFVELTPAELQIVPASLKPIPTPLAIEP